MRDRIRNILFVLVVLLAGLRGAQYLLDLSLFHLNRDARTIELGPDQFELHELLLGARAAVLVSDFDGEREQSRAFSAQLAATPVPLILLNGRNDREIENYLRAGCAVILDSMTRAREAAITAQVATTTVSFHERRVGHDYLVLLPGSAP